MYKIRLVLNELLLDYIVFMSRFVMKSDPRKRYYQKSFKIYKRLGLKLPLYELDKIVRENTDTYRLYEWKELERWREMIALISMRLESQELYANTELVDLINAYRVELRKQKNYEVSDRLRDILASVNIKSEDTKQ